MTKLSSSSNTAEQVSIKAKPSICIVAHNAYGALSGGSGHIGGVEMQTALVAKWLVGNGYQVSVLTWDEGGDIEEWIDGIRIIKICRRDEGPRGIRYFHPKWTALLKAMEKADADIYYHNCGECVTGQVGIWCKRKKRVFVFSAAADDHCDPSSTVIGGFFDRFLFRRGLQAADLRIVQTKTQQRLMRDLCKVDSVVIPMPCSDPVDWDHRTEENLESPRVVWLARLCREKMPERILKVAKKMPEIHFDIVGPADTEDYRRQIKENADSLPNVYLRGGMSRKEARAFLRKAVCLCCTSDKEGFPNTFLEAWSLGIPVVSTFDPDGIIHSKNLGYAAEGEDDLVTGIQHVMEKRDRVIEIGKRARTYYQENHSEGTAMRRFATALAEAGRPVAVVVISDLEFGGAQRQVVELANNMDPARFELHVVVLHDYVPLAGALNNVDRLHVIERHAKFDFTVVTRLARLLRKLKASVVHGFLFDSEIVSRLAGKMTGTAVIGSERNTDYTLKRINHLAFGMTRGCRDLTIANSSTGADFNSKLLGYDRESYRVVHNGVNTDRFSPGEELSLRGEWGVKPGEFLVGMFASFKPQKNHPLLLKAAKLVIKKLPGVRFVFVGDELFMGMSGSVEFKDTVQKQVDELDLRDHCIFAGNREDVENCYRACDLTVLPSLFEGTPNVALESMASGVPVVATDVSDNAFLIPDGLAGYVVPLDDEEAMADRIRRLLGDKDLRNRMSRAARARVLEEFTGERLAEKTARVYEEATGAKRR